jgi:NAD kinase
MNSFKNPLIIVKKTKYELDLLQYNDLSYYKKICKIQNDSYDKIYQSHIRQLESREYIRKNIFPKAKFIFREGLDSLNLNKFDLLIALGGDNHFTYVAHYCKNAIILGCNSDTKTSVGALLNFDCYSLENAFSKKWSNTKLDKWSLIQSKINYPNKTSLTTVNAVSEISIRNMSPDLTSRYLIQKGKLKEEQKSSGILLYTGAGSTGWYTSCRSDEVEPSKFSKSANYFKAYVRELSKKARLRFKLTDFKIDSKIKIISMMNGGISIDALPERIYPFPAGSSAEFYLSKNKLKVLVQSDTIKY